MFSTRWPTKSRQREKKAKAATTVQRVQYQGGVSGENEAYDSETEIGDRTTAVDNRRRGRSMKEKMRCREGFYIARDGK